MEDPYEMPHISDLLDKVAEACWLSKLDLNQGFCQIPMDQDSIAQLFAHLGESLHSLACPLG